MVKRIIYLSPVPLRSPVQRPHHFVRWAHERLGCEVWWVQPYPARLPQREDWRRLRVRRDHRIPSPSWQDAPWLRVLQPRSIPVEPLRAGRWLLAGLQRGVRRQLSDALVESGSWLVAGRPSALALELSQPHAGRRMLYDVMDDMPAFAHGRSQRWIAQAHAVLLTRAQAVWASSATLAASLQGRTREAVTLVRNGTVMPDPPDDAGTGIGSAQHARAPLVLGYVGTIAHWFDWPALERLAGALPEARFELHGPVHGAPPARLAPNVHLAGPVPHAQIFPLMRRWHAGLIPFARTRLTQSVDPVKYYEYRSCGLPVLSTMFGDMPEHARCDDGVWPLESLPASELPQRLRAWHERLAVLRAEGRPLAPRWLEQATWPARFEAGAVRCGWIGPGV